jgi:hypothetical protein
MAFLLSFFAPFFTVWLDDLYQCGLFKLLFWASAINWAVMVVRFIVALIGG